MGHTVWVSSDGTQSTDLLIEGNTCWNYQHFAPFEGSNLFHWLCGNKSKGNQKTNGNT